MRLTTLLARLVAVVVSIAACFLVLEGGLRVLAGAFYPKMMVLDDRLGWKHATDVSRTFTNELGEKVTVTQDEYGHRGPRRDAVRGRGTPRVLVLGDSFAEAVQVSDDEVFSAILERDRPGLEVLNAGVGGYGTVQELLYLRQPGLGFRPDAVLILVYENDLSDNCLSYSPGFGPRPYARRDPDGSIRVIEDPAPDAFLRFVAPVPFAETLNRHSYLFYMLNSRVYQRLAAERLHALEREDMRRARECGRYEIFERLVDDVADLLRSSGTPFALVLIPSRESAAASGSTTLEPIVDLCRRHGWSCRYLLDRFVAESAAGVRPFFPEDIHWTAAGHRIVAAELGVLLDGLAAAGSGPAS